MIRLLTLLSFLVLVSCKEESSKPALFLPDNLEATLWAESPMLYNPTNMDVDSRGRIWITEAVNYRNFNNDSTHVLHHQQGDRVMILEDTDGDGKADVSKVFIQDKDLISPLGIAVLGNKVFVSCSPNLLVYTDLDGDDVPDKKEIFLTGFGGLDHDHSLHALVAGPDGNYYFNVGNAGPHIVTDKSGWTLRSGSLYYGGTPYNTSNNGNMKSDDGKVWVGGMSLRIKPDATDLHVMGHNFRNSYETIIDSYGNLWQNDNDDQVVTCRTSWLMEGGNAGYFSSDGTRFWQADQRPGQDIFSAHWHQDDPGVMPAGDNTGSGSPTGIAFNESDALGEEYRGLLLSAEAGRNVIFSYRPGVQQSGYDLGQRTNLISSLLQDNAGYVWNDSAQNAATDKWFRPSDVTIGTEGAIYIADWYDPVVGGHQMKDSIGYGRIYRITPKNKKLNVPVIDLSTTVGQLEGLKNPAINVRNQAFEKLKAQGETVVDAVKKLVDDSNPYHQARAVWLLAQLGAKGKAEVENLLSHANPEIRATAFRALRQVDEDIISFAEQLSHDQSSFVRREVAIALNDLPLEEIKSVWLTLAAQYDGTDRWYLEALGRAAEGNEDFLFNVLKKANQKPDEWSKPFASIAWRLHPAVAVSDFQYRANSSSLSVGERSAALTALAFIPKKESVAAMIALTKNDNKQIAEQATYWLAFRQSNEWFALTDWSKTGVDTKRELQVAAMKAKRSLVEDEHQSIYERKSAARAMAEDGIGGQMILAMMGENKLPQDLMSAISELMLNNTDAAVRIQASNYFKKPGSEKIISMASIEKLQGNSKVGSEIFGNSCLTCHQINGKGLAIGPDLANIKKKFERTDLLDAIINPSAGIVFGYEAWLIGMNDGESVFGFLLAEGTETLVIKDLTGKKHTVPVKSISSRKKQVKSVMPEPAVLDLSEQNLADVVAYLLELK